MPRTPVAVYGIPNCQTVKKARAWLDAHGVPHTFHDFKKEGVPAERLQKWLNMVGQEALLNRKGTTWRRLDEATRASITDDASATALMLAQPSVIKRPVVEWSNSAKAAITVGFDEGDWELQI